MKFVVRLLLPIFAALGLDALGSPLAAAEPLQADIVTQLGHQSAVSSVAFSPDGRKVLTGSGDQTARLWDAATGRELRQFTGHPSGVLSVAFSPDGLMVLTGSWDETARLWDVASGRELRQFTGHTDAVSSVAFSPDGLMVLTGSYDKTARLWDAASGGAVRQLMGHTNPVGSVAFSPDGLTVLTGSHDKTGRLWDAASGRELRQFTGHTDQVNSVAFSPDGRTVLTGSNDGTARLWDVASGRKLRQFTGHTIIVNSVAFSPDGRTVLTGGNDHKARLWDAASARELRQLTGHTNAVSSVAFSPDGRTVLTGSWDNTARLWDAASGRELRQFTGHTYLVDSVAFAPDGRTVLTGSSDKTARLWDVASGRKLRQFMGHSNGGRSIAFSPDGRTVLTGGNDETARLWDAASGRELRRFTGHTIIVNSVAFSPDGRTVLTGSYDKTARLWDAASGRELRHLTGHSGWVNSVTFSPDGRTVLTGSYDKTARLWDAASGGELRQFMGHSNSVDTVAYSPDGRTVLTGSADGTTRVWDATSGAARASMISFADGEWLTITPEGFFDASSPKASENLNVVRGLEVYSIDQFYQALYRPDLVREKLAGDPRGLVREAASRLDLNKAVASGSAPDVRLTLPARGLSAASSQIAAAAEITDRGGGIGRVEWRVNGVTVGVDNPVPAAGGAPLRLTRSLALDAGDNDIDVVAYNSANLIASVPARVTVAAQATAPSPAPGPATTTAPTPAPVAAAPPRLFVLAAGTDNYADRRFRLQYSVPDAKAMAQAFVDAGKGLYQSVEVKLMSDAEVVTDKLDAAFQEISKKIQPTDVFVLYLAGHGKTVDGRYYYVPQNFRIAGEAAGLAIDAAVKAQGISQEQWQRWFALIPARKSVILFDTCESGTLADDTRETKALERGAANDRLAQATGRSIITASSGSTEAFEGYHGHGLFTYNLLDALDRGDGDNNGTIEVTELAAFVYAQVTAISERVFKQRQEPQMKITLNYALTRQTRVLRDAAPAMAMETKPTYQLTQTAKLQIKPISGATVVRSLSPKTAVTVLKSEGGWSLIASQGKPIGYVSTGDLAPIQSSLRR